jgi:hypothetical protein
MSVFCVWNEMPDRWVCGQCGAAVLRSASATAPFAGCKVGMRDAGVTPADITKAATNGGPGTELKKMLGKIGITASSGCSCNSRAVTMDAWGPDVCEKRIDEIVGWLKDEASKRRLPFIEAVGRKIVKWAIKAARDKTPVDRSRII